MSVLFELLFACLKIKKSASVINTVLQHMYHFYTVKRYVNLGEYWLSYLICAEYGMAGPFDLA